MRNLKRVLALAMAMVMILGMMVIGSSAASYSDAAAIDEAYTEAVEVLTGMGVFKGQGAGFAPKATLTRAEAAALIYRVITADVKDGQISLYDYASFTDVAEGAWYTGYITYAANGGFVKGDGTGKFNPNDTVTGIQVATILLRALGYGQNGEYEGAGWKDNVLTDANDIKMLKGIKTNDLDKAVSREVVAQLIWNALWADMVTYTPALGYVTASWLNSKSYLGWEKFQLAGAFETTDEWGRPGYKYTYKVGNKVAATAFAEAPIAEYYVATAECQIASDMDLDGNVEYDVVTYVNGVANKTVTKVNPTDVRTKIGAQGREIEVYADRIVIIDTYLAKVTKVVDAKFDKAGHMITPATMYLEVYDAANDNAATACYITNGDENYTYTAGSYILVNAWGESVVNNTKIALTVSEADYVEIVGVAESTVGAQTIIWQNSAKHTVAGTTYDDACQYDMDAAANIPNAQFTWFFDQYGNLIGSAAIKAVYTYATIADIQWYNPATANGYALATLVYTDGTTESVVVKGIDKDGNWTLTGAEVLSYTWFQGVYADGSVSMNYGYNADYIGKVLFAVAKDNNGVATLSEIKTVVSPVDVTKGNPVVAAGCYIDDNTQFLVRTGNAQKGYAYTPVTGYNQISSITAATVYYVNLDRDAAAEIVYMYGTAATSTTANLVYIGNDSYSYTVGTNDYITLGDAQIKGAAAEIVITREWMNGDAADGELKVGSLYYMVDTDGNGKYNVATGDVVVEVTTAGVTMANGVVAKVVPATGYDVLANALEITGEVVPYNITTAETYGNWTGNENIVIVYKNYTVSAIYVVK